MEISLVLILLLLFDNYHYCHSNIDNDNNNNMNIIKSLKKAPGVLFSPVNNNTVFIRDGNTLNIDINFSSYYKILTDLKVELKNTFSLHDDGSMKRSLRYLGFSPWGSRPGVVAPGKSSRTRTEEKRKTIDSSPPSSSTTLPTSHQNREYIFQLRETIDTKSQKLLNDFNKWCESLNLDYSSSNLKLDEQQFDLTYLLETRQKKFRNVIFSQFNETFGKLSSVNLLQMSSFNWELIMTIKNMIYNIFNTAELQFLQLQRGIDRMRATSKLDYRVIPYLEFSDILIKSPVSLSKKLSLLDYYKLVRVLSMKKKKRTNDNNNTFRIRIAVPKIYSSFFLYSVHFWYLPPPPPPQKGTTYYYPVSEKKYLAVKKDNIATRGRRRRKKNLKSIRWYFTAMKDLNECIDENTVSRTLYCRKKGAFSTETSEFDCLSALFMQNYTVAITRCQFRSIEQFLPVVHYLGNGIYTYNIPEISTLTFDCGHEKKRTSSLIPGYYFLKIEKGCTVYDMKNKINISFADTSHIHTAAAAAATRHLDKFLIIKPNISVESDVIRMWSIKSTHAAEIKSNGIEMVVMPATNWMYIWLLIIIIIAVTVGFCIIRKLWKLWKKKIQEQSRKEYIYNRNSLYEIPKTPLLTKQKSINSSLFPPPPPPPFPPPPPPSSSSPIFRPLPPPPKPK